MGGWATTDGVGFEWLTQKRTCLEEFNPIERSPDNNLMVYVCFHKRTHGKSWESTYWYQRGLMNGKVLSVQGCARA
jgi:hypothetical protein